MVYIYINTCMYIMKKSELEHFKWPYPAMMTQCSTYQAPKNTHRNLKTGLLAEFLAQIWQIFSHVPSSPRSAHGFLTDILTGPFAPHRFLTDFSQISHRFLTDFSQISHRFLTDFSQISHRFLTGFSQISHRLLTDFFLPMAEGNLWEICDLACVFQFVVDDSSNWAFLLVT